MAEAKAATDLKQTRKASQNLWKRDLILEAVARSIAQLQETFNQAQASRFWTERDLQFSFGHALEENLRMIDNEVRVHYDAPLSDAHYWFGGERFVLAKEALERALEDLGGHAVDIDLVAYKDDTIPPLFPLVAEVKYLANYKGSTMKDVTLKGGIISDLEKMRVVKKHNLALETVFFYVELKKVKERFESLLKDYTDKISIHPLLVERVAYFP